MAGNMNDKVFAPPRAQQPEQGCREHHVAVLAPFALIHTDHHALAVDVLDLERHHLRGAQSGPIGHRQGGLVLEPRCGLQEAGDLLGA